MQLFYLLMFSYTEVVFCWWWFCLPTPTLGFVCRYGCGFEISAIQRKPKLKCSGKHTSSCIWDWDEKVFSPISICPWDSYRKLLLVLQIHIVISVFVLTKIATDLIPFGPCFQSLPLFIAVSDVFRVFYRYLKKESRSLSYLLTSLSPFLFASSPNHLAWR